MEESARSQLRSARTGAGLSVRELSRRVGISPSMLSQIENGRSEPSVATLYGLVSALSISLDELLGGSAPNGEPNSGQVKHTVLRAEERAVLDMASGVRWERLTPDGDPLVAALLVTYPPGSSSSGNGGLMRHSGHEYGYLLEGELTAQVGFDTFVLHPGDSVSFDSTTPHLYRNDSSQSSKGIWHVVGLDPSETRENPF
ncbi:cupin domain-containing protein [Nocardioides sp. PD653-B2]|uniref:cupin domain-containing protein n=1 Tax=Nocardioides sp. PD653-B2 TaxID=1892811 RepID=UPI002418B13A|nr:MULTISPECIES: cupin domain-containing protein [unclassified Nocardioides]